MKSDSISITYEFRTKSAQSGALETNGPRERISVLSRRAAVQSSVRDALGYWGILRAKTRQRKFVKKELAEREGFEPPVRLPVLRISSAARSTTLPPLRKAG